MEIRYASTPKAVKHYTTAELREEFLVQGLFEEDTQKMVYSHIDRIIIGSIVPVKAPMELSGAEDLKAEYFLERREMGVLNLGGTGTIIVDDKEYTVRNREVLYVGMGAKKVVFASDDAANPARYYLNSAPAHKTYPTVLVKLDGEPEEGCVVVKPENKVALGNKEDSNERVICKYIVPDQVQSCQLVMGITQLKPGSVWNSMPCHTHDRRMEVYLYCDLPEDAFVMHYMGEPQETRHIVIRNEEAVISPSWSIHAGSGTRAYSFVWGMVGENQTFGDMDGVAMKDLM